MGQLSAPAQIAFLCRPRARVLVAKLGQNPGITRLER